jgi:hypothetical protein
VSLVESLGRKAGEVQADAFDALLVGCVALFDIRVSIFFLHRCTQRLAHHPLAYSIASLLPILF